MFPVCDSCHVYSWAQSNFSYVCKLNHWMLSHDIWLEVMVSELYLFLFDQLFKVIYCLHDANNLMHRFTTHCTITSERIIAISLIILLSTMIKKIEFLLLTHISMNINCNINRITINPSPTVSPYLVLCVKFRIWCTRNVCKSGDALS